MKQLQRLFLCGGIGVVVFDAVASVASRAFDFPYTRASIGSFVIYAVVGFVAGRRFGLAMAAAAGVFLGLVDASLGWAVSRALHANAPATPDVTPLLWVIVAITVSVTAAICAVIGGVVARATRKREAPAG
jgi:hypothetical protein